MGHDWRIFANNVRNLNIGENVIGNISYGIQLKRVLNKAKFSDTF